MTDVFISYERSTEAAAEAVALALRALGFSVWRDDEMPAHRAFTDVIEEKLRAARSVVVLWSAGAARSDWVRAEADRARAAGKLVQLTLDGTLPPMPFDQIQCANLVGWAGDSEAAGFRRVVASVAELAGLAARPETEATSPASPGPSAKPSIAVLPFANLSDEAGQDYFADGMVEEIITALARVRAIFVIAAASSLSFKGRTVTPQEAAASLGVRYVLEGSVRKAGGRVRIAVKLIDAVDRVQIWAERFDEDFGDIFALQDKIALAVAGVIEPRVQHAEIQRATARRTDSMGSYELYLRALALYRSPEPGAVFEAITLLENAMSLDPDHGLALALAAVCHRDIALSGEAADAEAEHRRMAIALADQALRAGGDDAEVLAFVGAVLDTLQGDASGALGLFDRAIALNPGSATAWLGSGMMRLRGGDTEAAADHFETSMRLDPLSPLRGRQLLGLGSARFQQERFAEAAALLSEAARLLPSPMAFALLIACHGHLGREREAKGALARFEALGAGPLGELARRGHNPRQTALCEAGLAKVQALNPPP
jgi:adenylate cyclase